MLPLYAKHCLSCWAYNSVRKITDSALMDKDLCLIQFT